MARRTAEQMAAFHAEEKALGKRPHPDGVHVGVGLTPGSFIPTPADMKAEADRILATLRQREQEESTK